ncbi:uncharacterized protein LOC118467002 [Anopheles albimanus]|uniref:uncharacterized protein LOC118467002 n=1 Tax=Anopheles albimanus TaxID=7167 RepID=UPI001640028C|nr:uncharacterized protein LOC118467002 [Anopheles albimanus]
MVCGKSKTKRTSFLPPVRYEWSKAYPILPRNHLIAHRDTLAKQPFRPSYEMHAGEPEIGSLLDWTYARIWQCEVDAYRAQRYPSPEEQRKAKKRFPIYAKRSRLPRGIAPGSNRNGAVAAGERFTMKQFLNVPAKVQSHHDRCSPAWRP